MKNLDIAHLRLSNQHLAGNPFEKPEEVVQWLGAVQAQDYGGAKWAVALRTGGFTNAALDQAFNEGKILRTHVLRPTWHFVSPADIRWMLELTAPRVNAFNAYYYRQMELDEAVFAAANAALVKALKGGQQLTRPELAAALQQAGIITGDALRFNLILMRAELDAVVCSGALRGKQHTYTLLAERAPQAKILEREEALAELARRYFMSRGPATLKDYIWWSRLAKADASAGLEMVKSQLLAEVVDGETYWFEASNLPVQNPSPTVYLLPNFDEYTVAYTDRGAIAGESYIEKLDGWDKSLLNYIIILDSQLAGSWKRTHKAKEVIVETRLFKPFSKAECDTLTTAIEGYGRFAALPVTRI
jgi:hypothetical protein